MERIFTALRYIPSIYTIIPNVICDCATTVHIYQQIIVIKAVNDYTFHSTIIKGVELRPTWGNCVVGLFTFIVHLRFSG